MSPIQSTNYEQHSSNSARLLSIAGNLNGGLTMKQNNLFTIVNEIATKSLTITNNEELLKSNKVYLSEQANIVVNHFVDNDTLEDLPEFLTDTFQAMDAELIFGVRGVKMSKTSTKDRVTYNMERAAKFFHRSIKSLDIGLKLTGYNPFVIGEDTGKVELSDHDKLEKICIDLGMDKRAIENCLSSLDASNKRAMDRQREAREAIRKEKIESDKQEALNLQKLAVDAFLQSGLTVEDIARLTTEKVENG